MKTLFIDNFLISQKILIKFVLKLFTFDEHFPLSLILCDPNCPSHEKEK